MTEPGAARSVPLIEKPASRADLSEASMVPPLQTAGDVTAEETSMTSVMSMSVKKRVPLEERS
jgi:hypothetical protein